MIRYTTGNLLKADAEALVNTVNTVGVMGKGIALMFKEAFPDNFRQYADAVKADQVRVGEVFVTHRSTFDKPEWIINFPTKKHWRGKSRIEWIEAGLRDLREVLQEKGISSVALPPLGCGHGGLDWGEVRPLIERELNELPEIVVIVYEPTNKYQNVAKRRGVEKLTIARALIAEIIRRYWILGIECSLLEIQKLAYLLEREIVEAGLENRLKLRFEANRYGPYSDPLRHLLESMDGSYLRSEVRIADAKPTDIIAFNDSRKDKVALFLRSDGKEYLPALNRTSEKIEGFESPLGMELLGTVHWLLTKENVPPEIRSLKEALQNWPGGKDAGARKLRLFDDRSLQFALDRLGPTASASNLEQAQ